ncbi:hypothetical protein [Bradyrhizobium sp. SZCCHNR2028]|uniref:hypothetical protein n=1 Tax=Bradyrhizobium sp. SZCCHNR2028 TaxID=3057382 RepID=UPI0028EE4A93|nr:hypothetical protein [Bradyrhizobium sp. SZCCHNR2028]
MRRISGVDINGWRDFAARDWDIEQQDVSPDIIRLIDGGWGSVAVKQKSQAWIGGPQAFIAPHGRGPGWGELGDSARRLALAPLLDDPAFDWSSTAKDVYRAAIAAIARSAEDIIITVPDVPEFDEAAQFRRLSIFHRDTRKLRLLWQPVAAFLHAVDSRAIMPDAEGALFCFLIHCGDGFQLQTLRLRRDAEHHHHLAPERDDYGSRVLCQVGLRNLLARIEAKLRDVHPQVREGVCDKSSLGLHLLVGDDPVPTEILRLNNGNWIELVPQPLTEADVFASDDFESGLDFGTAEPIAATFLLTPLAERFAAVLAARLQAQLPNLTRLGWDAVARGALTAGRLVERGLPHYFDRLTPIKLAVMRRDEPQFDDLVGSNATLPANKEYVSPPYRDLKWLAGKKDIEFYVLKGEDEIRFWKVTLDEAPHTDVAVELRLRQTPGQSWARLSLTSTEWEPLQRAPILLDWSTLAPLDATVGDILEKLKTPPPTIPLRVVEAPSMDFWTGTNRIESLNVLLEQMRRTGRYDLSVLADRLSRSQRDPFTKQVVRPVGTDGQLPKGLSERAVADLEAALSRCSQALSAAARRALEDNAPLRCLTWVFTRCPANVQDMIVEALEAEVAGQPSPLLGPARARRVLIQGAGRSVTGTRRVRRVLKSLVLRSANADTMNACAMILSRRDEAPKALTPELVERIATLASQDLIAQTERGAFNIRFKNALSAIAGLFRYREVEPYALMAERDPAVRQLRENLKLAATKLARQRGSALRIDDKLTLISSILALLDGAGDPAILVRIEDLDDSA